MSTVRSVAVIAVIAVIAAGTMGGLYVGELGSVKTVTLNQTVTENSTTTLMQTITSTYFATQTITITTSASSLSNSSPVYALISTTQGVMEVQLFPSVAPKTVANFVNLSNSGFYNNLVWHRIVAGFVIQTGDPNTRYGGGNPATWGTGGSNTTVPLETNSTDVALGYVNNEGYLGMARSSSPNSATSQFYINLANNTALNGQYTVFGKIISGMNVALAIGNLPVNSSSQPVSPSQAMLLSITIRNTP